MPDLAAQHAEAPKYCPQVDEEDLATLASLLYLPMATKAQLQRVFGNTVVNHSITRSQALRILLASLRSAAPVGSSSGDSALPSVGTPALQVSQISGSDVLPAENTPGSITRTECYRQSW